MPFSVRRMVLMISKLFIMRAVSGFECDNRAGSTREASLDLLEGAPSENQFVGPQHVIRAQRIAGSQGDIRHISRSERQVFVTSLTDDERAAFEFEGGQDTKEFFGAGGLKFEFVQHEDISGAQSFAQSLAQS